MKRKCSKCGVEKDDLEFYPSVLNRMRHGYSGRCKVCTNAVNKKTSLDYYHRNKKRRDTEARHYSLMRKFGIGAVEYDRLHKRQGGRCAICGIKQKDITMRFAVDHNHLTGAIRSLLCGECNLGLGKFKDSPELLRLAAKYLESNSTN